MALKIVAIFGTLLVVLLITQTIECEEVIEYNQPDVLYILNPDTIPTILTKSSNLLTRGDRSNLVCTADTCQRICEVLNFRFGRCTGRRVCECSN